MEDDPEYWFSLFDEVYTYGDCTDLIHKNEIFDVIVKEFKDDEKNIRNTVLGSLKFDVDIKRRIEQRLCEDAGDNDDMNNAVVVGYVPKNLKELDITDVIQHVRSPGSKYKLVGGSIIRWGKVVFYCANYKFDYDRSETDEEGEQNAIG